MPMREIEGADTPLELKPGISGPATAASRKVTDEERRHAAMTFAIQGQSANLNEDYVLKRAVRFEDYLKSGSV
jgi:hypothetical protein